MSGNCELGRGLRTREKNATEGGAGRFEKTAPDARAAPPEAHESLIGRKTVEEVPLAGLSSDTGDQKSDTGHHRLPCRQEPTAPPREGSPRDRKRLPSRRLRRPRNAHQLPTAPMASRASWLGSGTTLIAKALFVATLVVQLTPVSLDWRKVLYANPAEAVGVVLLTPLPPHLMVELSDDSTRA
jgi:hypothetical protein